MEKFYIATGKTIDLAIQAGLDALGMDRDSVSVEVLENAKTGFLGIGAAPAKVKVTYEVPDEVKPSPALSSASRSKPKKKEAAAAPAAKVVNLPKAAPKPAQQSEQKPEPQPEKKPEKKPGPKPENKSEPKPEKKPGPKPEQPAAEPAEPRQENKSRSHRGGKNKRSGGNKPKAADAANPAQPQAEQQPEPREYAPAEPGSTEERIEQFIQGLLVHMGSEAVPHAVKTAEDTYHVELVGENLGMLIGRRGDTLDAIQHLTNYSINRDASKRSRINVDAESYRAKREESLQRLARKVAGKVIRYRRNITLEPMNAYERHVIHAALQDMEEVSTFSTGTEPNRRVVVSYNRYKNTDEQN